MQKKKEAATGSKKGTESTLELRDLTEDTSERDVNMESCNNPQDVEGSTPELNVGTKEASKGETAMLQEEEDRPHYNPNQGGHSLVVYMLHLCHIAQLSWVPFLVLQPTISCTSVTFITLYVPGQHYHRITFCATLSMSYGQNQFNSNSIQKFC